MRRPFLFSLAALGLATSVEAQRPWTRDVVVIPGQVTRVIIDSAGTPSDVPFPYAKVFAAVRATFQELKLPTPVLDSVGGQVGTEVFWRRGVVAGRQISSFLSCGDGITGPYADTYRVYMWILTSLQPAGAEGTRIRTVILAGAVNVAEGAGRQPMPCESTGRLEQRINETALKKAAGV